MKKAFILILCSISLILSLSAIVFAVDVAPRISDREIIEKLTRLEEGQKAIQQQITDTNRRIDDMNRRIDDMNRRIDDLKESTNRRFDILQWMLGLFITVALSIMVIMGRILWNQQKKMTQMETSLETQKDEFSFLKTLIEKLLPPKGVL